MRDIEVLIVDDNTLIAQCVAMWLERSGILVSGVTASANHALEMATKNKPDVILLDYHLPDGNACDVLTALRNNKLRSKVLVFSAWKDHEHLAKSIIHGADGYISKEISLDNIVNAIRRVHEDFNEYDQSIIETAIDSIVDHSSLFRGLKHPNFENTELTEQEIRILMLLTEGLTTKDIAALLNRMESTVKTHVRHILGKLRVNDRTQAVIWAFNRKAAST